MKNILSLHSPAFQPITELRRAVTLNQGRQCLSSRGFIHPNCG